MCLCMRVIYYIYKLYTCICVFYECEEKKQEVKKEKKKKFHIMRFMIGIMRFIVQIRY